MNRNNEVSSLNKRKAEIDKTIKAIQQKREKTIYLYRIEKQSRRKAREQQLRVLLEYETKELQKAQSELEAITKKISAREQEQKNYHSIKIVGLVSFFIALIALAVVVMDHNYMSHTLGFVQESPSMMVEGSSNHPSWTASLHNLAGNFFAFLNRSKNKYHSENNLLTGAVVSVGQADG